MRYKYNQHLTPLYMVLLNRILLSILTSTNQICGLSRNLKLPFRISPLFPYQFLHIVIKVFAPINSDT